MKVKKVQINLHNKTTYLAKDLKKLCSFVLKRYLKTNYDFDHKQLHVYCEPHGGKNVSPSAILKNSRVSLSIPDVTMFNKSDKLRKLNNDVGLFDENHAMGQSIEQKIAAAFKWGLDVARGYSYPLKEYDVEIPVNIGTKKPKVKAKDSPEIQMKNALKRKTLWQRKMKRCQNAITKIDKEIKRFNKKLQPG